MSNASYKKTQIQWKLTSKGSVRTNTKLDGGTCLSRVLGDMYNWNLKINVNPVINVQRTETLIEEEFDALVIRINCNYFGHSVDNCIPYIITLYIMCGQCYYYPLDYVLDCVWAVVCYPLTFLLHL